MRVIDPIAVDSIATFSRASAATYWDYTGALQTSGVDALRVNWNREDSAYQGALIEPARTNLILNSAAPVTQTRTVTPGEQYTLSFYGTGSVTLSGAAAGTVAGSGTKVRSVRTFTATSNSLTLTVTVDLYNFVQYAQLEAGAYPTSVIVTAGSPVTRAADVVTGTGLVYSSFTDATPTYNAGTAYDFDAVVQYGTRKYKSVVAGVGTNTGNTPSASSTFWTDTGPTNPFAMFDRVTGAPSVGAATEELVIIKLPSAADSVVAFGMDATSNHLVISDGYKTFGTAYKEGSPKTAVLSGAVSGDILTLAIRKTGSFPLVGELVCGVMKEAGSTQYGLGGSFIDFSRKDTDPDFGTTTFRERYYKKTLDCPVWIEKADFNRVYDLTLSLRAKPSAWVATDDPDFSSMAVVYGFLKGMTLAIAYPDISLWSYEIEGLI